MKAFIAIDLILKCAVDLQGLCNKEGEFFERKKNFFQNFPHKCKLDFLELVNSKNLF